MKKNYPSVEHNGERFHVNKLKKVIDAIEQSSGATLYDIAMLAEVTVGYVRRVVYHVDAVKPLIRNGHLAISETGRIPAWAHDEKGHPLNIPRAPSTALVISHDFGNTSLRPELRAEVTDTTNRVASLVRKVNISPKSQIREVDVIRKGLIFKAEREEANLRYIESAEKRMLIDAQRIEQLQRLNVLENENRLLRDAHA